MKASGLKKGQLGLMLSLSVLVSSCNPEDYFPIEQAITGADAYCAKALDLNSCEAMSDVCQPAYMDQSEEAEAISEAPVFSACIANPDAWEIPDDGSTTGGGTSGGFEGGWTGGSSGGATTGGTSGGGSTGGTSGGSNGNANGGSNGGGSAGGSTGGSSGGSDDGEAPVIEDVIKNKCENLDPQYLLTEIETKKGKVIKTNKKVKICHLTGNGSSHTIVIACPALNAHKKHHDDYIGACNL